jgi:hypothetical protein
VAAFEAVFNPPKSFSALWALGDRDVKADLAADVRSGHADVASAQAQPETHPGREVALYRTLPATLPTGEPAGKDPPRIVNDGPKQSYQGQRPLLTIGGTT